MYDHVCFGRLSDVVNMIRKHINNVDGSASLTLSMERKIWNQRPEKEYRTAGPRVRVKRVYDIPCYNTWNVIYDENKNMTSRAAVQRGKTTIRAVFPNNKPQEGKRCT